MEPTGEMPTIIDGGIAVDDRGSLMFANPFDFKGVKRFYAVENFSTETIRAFHGHLKESKYAFVASGTAIVAAVAMDDTKEPNKGNAVQRFVLSSKKPCILYIPAGFANGFRFLTPHGKIFFFSTSTTEESKGDDYRFPADYWGSEVWEVIDR
ncbi:MAG: putative sugar epimerase [Parcubacteria group bacterium]|nr:putative sugar epimerase [Parcubacteria group bacterium]